MHSFSLQLQPLYRASWPYAAVQITFCDRAAKAAAGRVSRVFLNFTACLFLHVWIRPCMGTLSTPVPCPARAVTGTKTGCQLAGRLCSSAGTQGHSTHAAIPMLLLALGEHWGCCLPRVWVVVGAARARLGGLKSYGASCCGYPHHPRLCHAHIHCSTRYVWAGVGEGLDGI